MFKNICGVPTLYIYVLPMTSRIPYKNSTINYDSTRRFKSSGVPHVDGQMVFVMEMQNVLCEVGNKCLYVA